MVKKLFALASLTALAGLVSAVAGAGCSVTTTETPADSGTTTDAAVVKDTGPVEEEEDAGPAKCPIADAVDTTDWPFHPPNPAVSGACTQADLTAMEGIVAKTDKLDLPTMKAAVSASCQACAFGDAASATWAPLVSGVTIGDETGDIANYAACYVYATGKNDCGKAFAELEICTNVACNGCTDATTFGKCKREAAQGVCKPQQEVFVPACGGTAAASAALTACGTALGKPEYTFKYSFEPAIISQCSKAPGASAMDGGTDAGDAGDAAVQQ